MINYFDNLISKTLGLTEAARPRLASLFEPSMPAELAGQFSSDEEAPAIEMDQSHGGQDRYAETRGPASRASNAEETRIVVSRHEPNWQPPSSDKSSDQNRGDQKENEAPAAPLITNPEVISNTTSPVAAVDTKEPDDRVATQEQFTVKHSLRSPALASDQSLAPPDEAASATSSRTAEQEAPPRQSLVILPEIKSEIRPERSDQGEYQSPLGSIAPPLVEPETPRDQAPVIKITIGRVDVRAVPPQLPAPRPSPERRPTLSLDDYLKRRSGGKP